MATSYRAFQIELYEEYLSDGGFVALQRETLLADPFGKWGPIRNWEDRLEAYVDGLCVGGDLAVDVCRRRAVEGEPGEFLCALKVFYRAGRVDLIEQAITQAEAQEGPKAEMIPLALLHEDAAELPRFLGRLIQFAPRLLTGLAKVAGHRRLPLPELQEKSLVDHVELLWPLARLHNPVVIEPLRRSLRSDDRMVRTDAMLHLLRMENHLDPYERWPLTAFGLMGSVDSFGTLAANPDPDASLALGLLGAPAAIPHLISRLPQPEAALALQLITGAGLLEQQPMPDEALEPGDIPATVTALSLDPLAWAEWWNKHAKRFSPDGFYRCGQSYAAERLAALLLDPDRMHCERRWIAEQLTARHGLARGFEVDMLARDHAAALSL